MCPWGISLLHHLSPSEKTQEQERHLTYHEGEDKFNDVKERQDKLPLGGELTPATNFSRSGADLSVTPSL